MSFAQASKDLHSTRFFQLKWQNILPIFKTHLELRKCFVDLRRNERELTFGLEEDGIQNKWVTVYQA